jgi:hypothetical protein
MRRLRLEDATTDLGGGSAGWRGKILGQLSSAVPLRAYEKTAQKPQGWAKPGSLTHVTNQNEMPDKRGFLF